MNPVPGRAVDRACGRLSYRGTLHRSVHLPFSIIYAADGARVFKGEESLASAGWWWWFCSYNGVIVARQGLLPALQRNVRTLEQRLAALLLLHR